MVPRADRGPAADITSELEPAMPDFPSYHAPGIEIATDILVNGSGMAAAWTAIIGQHSMGSVRGFFRE